MSGLNQSVHFRQADKMLLTVVLMLVSIATYAQGAGQCCMPLQYEAFQGSMVSKIKNGKFSTMFVSMTLQPIINKSQKNRHYKLAHGLISNSVQSLLCIQTRINSKADHSDFPP